MKGFELLNGDLIGFIDADNSITPAQFMKLYDNIGNNLRTIPIP